MANVTLAGGETASLPGIVTELDLSELLSASLTKILLSLESICMRDVLIGLPSSGIHSNGFSLVRSVIGRLGLSYTDQCPFDAHFTGRSLPEQPVLSDVLLIPTKIYCEPVVQLLQHLKSTQNSVHAVHGIAHITGGGLSNLLRLHDNVGWHIDAPMPIPPEFTWLQEAGNVTDLEMHRTFNMGLGMVLAVEREQADSILSFIKTYEPNAAIIGSVHDDGHKVTHQNPMFSSSIIEAVRSRRRDISSNHGRVVFRTGCSDGWPGHLWCEGRTFVHLKTSQERPTHMPRGPAAKSGTGFMNPAMAPALHVQFSCYKMHSSMVGSMEIDQFVHWMRSVPQELRSAMEK